MFGVNTHYRVIVDVVVDDGVFGNGCANVVVVAADHTTRMTIDAGAVSGPIEWVVGVVVVDVSMKRISV